MLSVTVSSISDSNQISAKNKTIAECVLKNLQPVLIKSIQSTMDSLFKELVNQLNEKVDHIAACVQKSALLNLYDNDRLEQYTRREES